MFIAFLVALLLIWPQAQERPLKPGKVTATRAAAADATVTFYPYLLDFEEHTRARLADGPPCRTVEQLADGVAVKILDKPVTKELLGERFTLYEVTVLEGKFKGWRGFLEAHTLKRETR